jgi:predicted AlkP superfamily pyrophosphatase or phosphodiesterase
MLPNLVPRKLQIKYVCTCRSRLANFLVIYLFRIFCFREYLDNIAVVDNIVSEVEDLVANYFKDDQTLFVFTSDHGMTDWGG